MQIQEDMIQKYKHQSKYDKRKLAKKFRGSDDEKRCSALITMMYLTISLADGYMEEAKDILQQYGQYTFDTKAEGEDAIRSFDRYHRRMFNYFKGHQLAQKQFVDVFGVLKKACDEEILASIEQYTRNAEAGHYERENAKSAGV